MDPSDTQQAPSQKVSGRTTPTWETELLLSGATVFALIQAAGAFLWWGADMLFRLDASLRLIFSMLFTYGFAALVMLALAFVLQLALRAYWVALVGMNSVFPGGLHFDRIRAGPLAKELLTRNWPDIDTAIERADNRATIVFGLGVSIAMALVPVSLTVVVLFVISSALASVFGRPDATAWVFVATGGVWLIPFMVAATVDRYWGHRLEPGGWGRRTCLTTLSIYSRIGMSRSANPLLTLFSTNVGERRGGGVVFLVMTVAMFSSVAGLVVIRNDLGMGSYGAFPEPRRGMLFSAEGRNYSSRHDKGWSPVVPYIPDMVAKGDYLPLVVPYVPVYFSHLLERCEGAQDSEEKIAEEQLRRERLRDCMVRGVDVTLDGKPVAVGPDWYTEPARDLRGLLYMVPVSELSPGRHELVVLPAPKSPSDPDEEAAPGYRIPFWR